MTLYQDLVENGIEIGHRESDLYFPLSEQTIEILKRHPLQNRIAERFINQIDGTLWFDIPFAYIPFWERRFENRF